MNLRTWIIPENFTLAKAGVITQGLFWVSIVLFFSSTLLSKTGLRAPDKHGHPSSGQFKNRGRPISMDAGTKLRRSGIE